MKPEKEKLNEVNSKTIKERKKVIVPIILLLTSIVILLISIALINNGVIEGYSSVRKYTKSNQLL